MLRVRKTLTDTNRGRYTRSVWFHTGQGAHALDQMFAPGAVGAGALHNAGGRGLVGEIR
jgi:hypothetical protein